MLNVMTTVSDALENKGMIHIADAIIGCAESIAVENAANIAVRLEKISNILETKGESQLSEQVGALVPEILEFEKHANEEDIVEEPSNKFTGRVSADKAYLMATKLREKYAVGLIDQNSFEHSKMKELESMLKTGFLLPPPPSCKALPENAKNWWEYFSNGGK